MKKLLIIYNELCPFNIDIANQVYHILKNGVDIKIKLVKLLGQMYVDKIFCFHDEISFRKIKQKYEELNIKIITIFDDTYPNYLLHLDKPPIILYVKGDITLLKKQNTLALLSCNQYSNYTEKIIDEILSNKKIVVVGSLLNISNQYIYEKVMYYRQKCINILCTNFLSVYPNRTIFLQKKLEKDHVVVTEIPLSKNSNSIYLKRVRELVGAFSKAILLLEEDNHCYNLITIDAALNMGKSIYVVPQHLFYKNGIINNLLLRDGAKIYMTVDDILEC